MNRWSLTLSDAPPPGAAIEMAADRVVGANISARGGRFVITARSMVPLPDGALVPSLTNENVRDRTAVSEVLGRVLEALGRPRRIALVLPDLVAKISLVRFEQIPSRRQDLDQLVRWQVRKAAPFPAEEAQVSWVEGLRSSEGQEFVVSLARRAVIEEYESLCTAAGAHAGLIDTATFNVVNAVLAGAMPSAADWLLVNVATDYTSVVILRGPHVIFFRSRSVDAEGTLADLVHQTAMYYEDRLNGGGFDRVLLGDAAVPGGRQAAEAERIRQNLEDRLGKPVETVGSRMTVDVTDRSGGSPEFLGTLAPLVGVLLRGQEASA